LGLHDTNTHDIKIAGDKFSDNSELVDTLNHEVGHEAFDNLGKTNPEVYNHWVDMHNNDLNRTDGLGFVSDYARSNPHEDFAESFKEYKEFPEHLKNVSPEKYDFMKNEVFHGQDVYTNASDVTHSKGEVSFTGNYSPEEVRNYKEKLDSAYSSMIDAKNYVDSCEKQLSTNDTPHGHQNGMYEASRLRLKDATEAYNNKVDAYNDAHEKYVNAKPE
jgi:hypothetical protein